MRIVISLLMIVGCLPLQAQESESAEKDDIYDLPVFTVDVSQDRGYLATNAISATSLNMAIRDLPMPIQVITNEFITDIQATDLREALAYTPGVYSQTFQSTSGATSGFQDSSPSAFSDVNDPFANTFSIRGYNVPNQQRMGFRLGANIPKFGVVLGGMTDNINTERAEVVFGPNALLYGVNVLSGVVNIIPKRPLSKAAHQVNLSAGSYGYLRASLDTTGPLLPGKLNYRFMTAYQENDDWTMFRERDREYYAGQLEYIVNPRIRIFAEISHGRSNDYGNGAQFVQDDLYGAYNFTDVRNEYYEFFTWGKDFTEADAEQFLDRKPGKEYSFPTLGDDFRITGPDTYYKSEEWNYLMTINLNPLENLNLEFGGFYSDKKEDRRMVDIGSFTNAQNGVVPDDRPDLPNRRNFFLYNPEYDSNDPLGFGPGEAFIVRDLRSGAAPNATRIDQKFARYMWYDKPSESRTLQLRARFSYSLDTEIFRIPIRHTFTGGAQLIEDSISFVSGGPPINDNYTEGRLDTDPYYFRNIFDYSVLHYNGETLAIPGNVNRNRMGGLNYTNIARSGWFDADLWYRGLYGIYQAQLWNDRLTFIGGVRHDSYQAKERELLRATDSWVDQQNRVSASGQHYGIQHAILDQFVGDGTQDYVWNSSYPDELNQAIENDLNRLRGVMPEGTITYNFPESQTFDTGTMALSYRLTDSISMYVLYAEGVFPNTGQRDGSYNSIGPETTNSQEVGFKFEFFDRKISGTISFFRMNRTNAVTFWADAPNPSRWHGGLDPIPGLVDTMFDPAAARGEVGSVKSPDAAISYGIARPFLQEIFTEQGLGALPRRSTDPILKEMGVSTIESRYQRSAVDPVKEETYYFFEYEDITQNEILKAAFDAAIRDKSYDGNPIMWEGGPDGVNKNNPSNRSSLGANVLFDEEALGVDGQIVFSPLPNYQIIFGYSYINREVVGNGFKLADPVDVQTGIRYATEYDKWVYILGPDAFDDPKDPTSTNGKGVNGIDLSFAPKLAFSLWHKYTFKDGPLDGVELGSGVRYYGPAVTSTPIGGAELAENRFRTPDTKERFVVDASIGYAFDWQDIRWRLQVKFDNIFNDHVGESFAYYDDGLGGTEVRRSRILYEPRGYRISLSADF